jgi:hypothetical protein
LRLESSINQGKGQLRFADSVRKINIEFAAVDVQFLGIGLDLEKVLAGFRTRIAGQKKDKQFAGFDIAALGEGVAGNHLAQIGSATEDDLRTKTEFAFDLRRNAFAKPREILFLSFENNVAALHICLWILQLQGLTKGSKNVHLDLVVSTNVDPAKHANDDGHRWCSIARGSTWRRSIQRSIYAHYLG